MTPVLNFRLFVLTVFLVTATAESKWCLKLKRGAVAYLTTSSQRRPELLPLRLALPEKLQRTTRTMDKDDANLIIKLTQSDAVTNSTLPLS